MSKDGFFNTLPQSWNSIFGMEIDSNVNESLLIRSWDNIMDQSDPFESALSSFVSSPVSSHPGIPIPVCQTGGESVVLKELIGRLGSICNSGEISRESCLHGNNNSTNTSCYNTPLNSPPTLYLSIHSRTHQSSLMNSDPGFVERAARFSCLGVKEVEFQHMVESGKISRGSSNQSLIKTGGSVSRLLMNLNSENKEVENNVEESSLSEQNLCLETGIKGRKRKVISKGKLKDAQVNNKAVRESEKKESDAKRSKSEEEGNGTETEKEKEKTEGNGNQKQMKKNAKLPELPKDYIHVRARRGQATDSHSLAERVRREKISERMKFLQDLVPGCNKVTGKAVMLDEIINYVQSLQRQVEFLSMKLATVSLRTDVKMEALLSKDTFHTRASLSNTINHMDVSAQPFYSMVHDAPENALMAMMHHGSNMKSSQVDGFSEASTFWENDLQSVVQMGFGQNQGPSFHRTMGVGQMKVEL